MAGVQPAVLLLLFLQPWVDACHCNNVTVDHSITGPGKYFSGHFELSQGPFNDWHYVTVVSKSGNDYTWTNRAGFSWTITFQRKTHGNSNIYQFSVGEDCPYYAQGYTQGNLYTNSEDVEIEGPYLERYTKLKGSSNALQQGQCLQKANEVPYCYVDLQSNIANRCHDIRRSRADTSLFWSHEACRPGWGLPITSSSCPKIPPRINDICDGSSLECFYGKKCCCGKCHAEFKAECIYENGSGRWQHLFTEACQFFECEPGIRRTGVHAGCKVVEGYFTTCDVWNGCRHDCCRGSGGGCCHEIGNPWIEYCP